MEGAPQLDFSGFLKSEDANLFEEDEATLLSLKVSQPHHRRLTSATDDVADSTNPFLYERADDWHQRLLVGPPYSVQDVQINLYIQSDQMRPSVAILKDDSFIIAWQSQGQDGSGAGVYARRYSNDTAVYNQEFLVNTYTPHDQTYPFVAALKDGGFIITWTSDQQDSSNGGVYAQRYYANATKYGPEFQVNQYVTLDQVQPRAISLADGGYLITWASYKQNGSDYGVYAQIYNSNGQYKEE